MPVGSKLPNCIATVGNVVPVFQPMRRESKPIPPFKGKFTETLSPLEVIARNNYSD